MQPLQNYGEESVRPEVPSTEETITPNSSIVYRVAKRALDVVASGLGMIVLSPIFLLTALAVKIEDPKGKVFYHQPRIGQNGSVFSCHKFRSMYANADEIKASLMSQNEMDGPVFKMRHDPRITRVGRIIRKLSIDELPQLFNVFKGELSLVGPRPLPVEEELACNAYQRQRELVKPGITCYWQISGRNDISFEQWIELDFKYIREQSLWTDLKILLKTIPAVLSTRGGY